MLFKTKHDKIFLFAWSLPKTKKTPTYDKQEEAKMGITNLS